MKNSPIKKWLSVCTAGLTTAAAATALADQPAAASKPEKSYTGTVVSVDPQECVLSVKEWVLPKKTFNLGDNCIYDLLFTTVENDHGTANDLRPGEKLVFSYDEINGVNVVNRIGPAKSAPGPTSSLSQTRDYGTPLLTQPH